MLCELWLAPASRRHGDGEATNAATPQPLRVGDYADMLWLWSGSQKGLPHGALFHLPFVKCYEIYGCREEQKWKHCTPSSYFPYLNNLTSLCPISWCSQQQFRPHPYLSRNACQLGIDQVWYFVEPFSYPSLFCATWKAAWREKVNFPSKDDFPSDTASKEQDKDSVVILVPTPGGI